MAEVLGLDGQVGRVTATELVTPAGRWPLLAIGEVRLQRIEPDVGAVQAVFLLALIAFGFGLRRLVLEESLGLLSLVVAGLLVGVGLARARGRRPYAAVMIEVDGAQIEALRTADEQAAQRIVDAVEQRRPVATMVDPASA